MKELNIKILTIIYSMIFFFFTFAPVSDPPMVDD